MAYDPAAYDPLAYNPDCQLVATSVDVSLARAGIRMDRTMDHLIPVFRFTVVDILNGGQLGSASAGGAGAGNVVDNTATGVGTGVANAGPGKTIFSLKV